MNEYDELLKELSQGTAPTTPAPSNPYDSALVSRESAQETGLRKSVVDASKVEPERQARAMRIAARTGLPSDLVLRNLDAYEARAKVAETPYRDMIRDSPELTGWLEEKPENAAVSHDDLEPLGFLEWLTKAPARARAQGQAQQAVSRLRLRQLAGETLSAKDLAELAAQKEAMTAGGELGAANSWFRGAITGTARLLPTIEDSLTQGLFRGAQGATAGMYVGALGGPGSPVTVPSGAALGFQAGMMTGGAEVGFALEAGLAYDEFLDFKDELGRPIDERVARAAALTAGAINGVLEGAGVGVLLKTLPGAGKLRQIATREMIRRGLRSPTIRAALLQALGTSTKALTQETAIEVAQRGVTIFAGESGKVAHNATLQDEVTRLAPNEEAAFQKWAATNKIADVDAPGSFYDYRGFWKSTGGQAVTFGVDHFPDTFKQHGHPTFSVESKYSTGPKDGGRWEGETFITPDGQRVDMLDKAQAEPFLQARAEATKGKKPGIPLKSGEEIVGELVAEGKGASQAMLGLVLPGPALTGTYNATRAAQAKQREAFFVALGEGVAQSKTATRMPEALQSFVERATKDGPVETVYAPVEAWSTYWQEKGADPAQIAADVTGDTTAYQTAVDTGADLAIPTARYAAKIAGTEHNAFFARELRLAPKQMNAREADAFEQAVASTAGAAAETEAPDPGAAEAIRQDTVTKLTAIGVPKRIAETMATLNEHVIPNVAMRARVDPVALYRGLGFTIGQGESLPPGSATIPADVSLRESATSDRAGDTARSRAEASDRRRTPRRKLDDVPEAARAHFDELVADARANGYTGTDDALADRYLDARDQAREAVADVQGFVASAATSAPEFLKAIAAAGGLGIDAERGTGGVVAGRSMQGGMVGELEALLEEFAPTVTEVKKTKKGNERRKGKVITRRLGDVAGIKGIVKRTGGQPADRIFEALNEDGRFRFESLADMLEAIRAAIRDVTRGGPAVVDTGALEAALEGAIGVRPGSRWWEGADDTELGQSKAAGDRLIIQHNLTVENLRHALKLGGIPVPSLAIAKAGEALTGFGEITLIGPREMADPRGYARTRVYAADVYSPRYPTVHLKFSKAAERKVWAVFDAQRDVAGSYLDVDQLEREGAKYLENEGAFMAAFLQTKGITVAPVIEERNGRSYVDSMDTRQALRRRLSAENLTDEFAAWVAAFVEDLQPSERIYKGNSDTTGRPLYSPHTLENVVRTLKKDLVGGEASANIYGVGQLRSRFAPKFRSLTGIQAERDRIVTDEEFETVKQTVETELFALVDDLKPYYKHGVEMFRFTDTVMNVIDESLRLGLGRALAEYGFVDVSDATRDRIHAFMNTLRAMPTEYFEAKILREVDLAEFKAAVIPSDAPADIVAALEGRGVELERYQRNDKADRQRAVEDVTARLGETVLFQDDLLSTGERQPRLPGAEDVREQEVELAPVAELRDEFSLSGKPAEFVAVQDTLFGPPVPPAKPTRAKARPVDPNQTTLFQDAWHGSPHIFERFSLQAIGSGEGAQVYGWGLYFASRKDIAEYYREGLAGKPKPKRIEFDGVDVLDPSLGLAYVLPERAGEMWTSLDATRRVTPELVRRGVFELFHRMHFMPPGKEGIAKMRAELERTDANFAAAHAAGEKLLFDSHSIEWEKHEHETVKIALAVLAEFGDRLEIKPPEKPGRLYKVDIPDDGAYLDWEKSLDQQSPAVRAVLDRAIEAARPPYFEDAKALLIKDALARLRDPSRADELVDVLNRMLSNAEDRDTNLAVDNGTRWNARAESNWRRLVELTPGLEHNRIHDVAVSGWDERYLRSVADRLMNERAREDAEMAIERFGGAPDVQYAEHNPQAEDPAFPYEVRDAVTHEVIDSYDNADEAQAAADAANEEAATTFENDLIIEASNGLNWDEFMARARDELGISDVISGETTEWTTGASLYEAIARTRGQEGASRFLASLGLAGIKYLDASSRDAGAGTHNFVVFDDNLIKIVDLEQLKDNVRRGAIHFQRTPDGVRNVRIDLLAGADLSTFLHESGHLYFEVLGDLSDAVLSRDLDSLTGSERQLAADYGTLLTWLGAERREDLTREQLERFARAFEAYLMEGKAPSIELRSAFARFRAWLTGVYRSLRGLKVELTDDVRGVFDRLVATDEAIEAAKAETTIAPLFTDPAHIGMTAEQFAAYQTQVAEVSQRAQETVQRQILKEYERGRAAWWQAELEDTRRAVAAELATEPVYQALAAIQKGTTPTGESLGDGDPQPMRLSREALEAQYGPGAVDRLPRPMMLADEGAGSDPDALAMLFGFSSGDEMLTAIGAAPTFREAVDQEAQRRMIEKHGDLRFDRDRAVDAAEAALHGEHRQAIIQAELAELTKGMSAGVIPPANTLRTIAEERIAGLRIRDIRPGVYLQAAQRASDHAYKLLSTAQDRPGAVAAKQQELVNLALYRAARDAQTRVEKVRARLLRLTSPAARQRLGLAGPAYLEAVDELLDRYDLARVSNKSVDKRAALRRWVDAMEAEGRPVELDPELLNAARRVNWRDVSVDELVGVGDAIAHIAHLARTKNRLLKSADQRELDAIATDIAAAVAESSKGRRVPAIGDDEPGDTIRKNVEGGFAWLRKLSSLARQMDGGVDNGPVWRALVRPINAAADDETVMREEATIAFAELLKGFSSSDLAGMRRKFYMPAVGASLSRADRIMVALNWGNTGNRQRMMSGFGWDVTQAQAVIDSLDAKDWAFVTGVWRQINSYWPAIAAKQQRVYGIAPERVEPAPFETRYGVMPGGYFPIKWNPDTDPKAFSESVKEAAEQMMKGAVTAATTKRGHTRERLQQVHGRRVHLSLDVIWRHTTEVVHDLTHHEMLIDVNRILRHKVVSAAIREHYGPGVYRELQAAVADVAAGDIPVLHRGERALEWLRKGTSVARMGWNLMTSTLQPLGLTSSMVRIGPKWVARGLSRWIGDAARMENSVRWVHERSAFMRLRHKTLMREVAEIQNRIAPRGSWVLSTLGSRILGETGAEMGHAVASKYAAIEDTYFWFISRAQMVADIPTWLGAYEKARASAADDETAIALADQAVIDAQGSGHIKDLARAQRGTPALKLFTQFYSYFSVVHNLGAEAIGRRKIGVKNPAELGRLAVDLLMLYTVPVILETMLREALTGEGDDDDDIMLTLVRNQAAYAMNTLPFVRELSGAVMGFPYAGPAGAGAFSDAAKLVQQVAQGEADEALLRALNTTAGVLFHYPSTQVERLVRAAVVLEEHGAKAAFESLFGGRPE